MHINGPFSARTIREARVQAADRPNGRFRGGPVLGDDPASAPLRHTRGHVPVDIFAPDATYPRRLAGRHAYLGLAFSHFGHAMAEMIHRIVPTRQLDPEPRWLILGGKGAPATFAALPSVCRTILGLFGIDERHCTVVCADTIVEELLVVEAGSDLGGGPKDWYLDLMRAFAPTLVPPGDYPKRLYVSRSGLGDRSGFLGERVLDAGFAAAGFHVLHPEALPLAEQIGHYANAEVLVFAEGSACHGVEVFGRDGLGHAILINRRNKVRSQFDLVLGPRSARFDAFTGNPYLGSVFVNPAGVPLVHLGVSAIALPELSRFFAGLGIEALGDVAPAEYLAAAEEDLEHYLTTAPDLRSTFDPALGEGLRTALRAVAGPDGVVAVTPRIPPRILREQARAAAVAAREAARAEAARPNRPGRDGRGRRRRDPA